MATHSGTRLAVRTASGIAALGLATLLGVALPTGAHAGTVAAPVIVDKLIVDKRSHDPRHPPPSPDHTPTGHPTPVPSDPPTSDPPGTPPPDTPTPTVTTTGTAGGQPVPPPVPKGSSGGVSAPGVVPVANKPDPKDPQPGSGGSVILGRQLPAPGPGDHRSAPVPAVAPVLGANDTVRLAGTAMPLWLIVATGALVVIMIAVGLALTLRDRDHEPPVEGLDIFDGADTPAGVKFG